MSAVTPATAPLSASMSATMLWNDSDWVDLNSTDIFNTTFPGTISGGEPPSMAWLVLTGLALSLLILVAILGNALVLVAFLKDRRLCTPANYLIASMAVADLLVSVSVMPLSATHELMEAWRLGRAACDLWISLDVTCCTASILSLCVIALDRYWAITDAVKYMHQRTTRRAAVMVTLVWVASLCISVPPLFGWRTAQDVADPLVCRISQDYGYTIFSTFGAFYIPTAVILVVYWKIFRAAQRRIRVRVGAQVPHKMTRARSSEEDTAANTRPAALTRQSRRQVSEDNSPEINISVKVIAVKPMDNGRQETTMTSTSPEPPAGSSTKTTSTDGHAPQATTVRKVAYEERFSKAPCVATVSEGIAVMERHSDGTARAQNLKKKIVFSKERRAAKTLGIITGVFIVCWLPFFLVALIEPFCASCVVSPLTRGIINWLGYANSAMNPVLYGFVNKDFQKAFQKIFRRRTYNQ